MRDRDRAIEAAATLLAYCAMGAAMVFVAVGMDWLWWAR